jgi:NAD+ synthase
MKSEVFLLAAYLKIPESILQAQPSDGLYGNEKQTKTN